MLLGSPDPERRSELAAALVTELGPGDLVLVSADFTHHGERFGWAPFTAAERADRVRALDQRAWEAVGAGDPTRLDALVDGEGARICGRHPLALLAEILPPDAVATELDYGVGAADGLVDDETGSAALDAARVTLSGAAAAGPNVHLGVFVSLWDGDRLRGCQGWVEPRTLSKAVPEATRAAMADPRFPPVTALEATALRVTVSLLGPLHPVDDVDAALASKAGLPAWAIPWADRWIYDAQEVSQ